MKSEIAFCLAMFVGGTAHAGSICIDGSFIFSGDTRVINIYDEVCRTDKGNFTVIGGQYTRGIDVCFSDSGYATVIYRNVTNNGPSVRAAWLKNDDCIKP